MARQIFTQFVEGYCPALSDRILGYGGAPTVSNGIKQNNKQTTRSRSNNRAIKQTSRSCANFDVLQTNDLIKKASLQATRLQALTPSQRSKQWLRLSNATIINERSSRWRSTSRAKASSRSYFARTAEGRKRALGLAGSPSSPCNQMQEARARKEAGEALTDIGRSFNVSHSTISRL